MKTAKIWELIEESFKEDEARIYQLYSVWFITKIDAVLYSNFPSIKEFLIAKYGEKDYGYSDEINFIFKLLNDNNGIVKVNDYDSILHELIQYEIERNKWKLKYSVFSTLAGVDIVDCSKISFIQSVKGFEGTWSFVTKENEKAIFETKAIWVCGAIKIEHYRYISHIIGNTKIQSDNRIKNEILKALKEENPELKKKLTPEEKELKKRKEKIEGELKHVKWMYECQIVAHEDNKKRLNNIDNEPLLGVQENKREEHRLYLKEMYQKNVISNEKEIIYYSKRLQNAETELKTIQSTDLVSIKKELELKSDKKLIKKLKDKKNSYSLSSLKSKNVDAYNEKLKSYNEQLESLYTKYPAIKAKDIRAQIKGLENSINNLKISLRWKDIKPELVEQKNTEIKQYEEEIQKLKTK